jgi:diaminopimelate epimerase
MLLEGGKGQDFHMVYYNADGNESTMCGNGGRCITLFAQSLNIITTRATFTAIDGIHTAHIQPDGQIELHMQDVKDIQHNDGYSILNTGSPHFVKWVKDAQEVDVYNEGKLIRNRPDFQPNGINVNFVQNVADRLWVRTYERGVEDETLSCGTGVTAAAIAATCALTGAFNTVVHTPGGILHVRFEKDSPSSAKNVTLIGAASFVFKGEITI